jgi:hypothetical protein
MKLKTVALAAALSLGLTTAYAQSPGNSAGATAGGSSASGGMAASSTTTGSSMNGSTTGNNGPSQGLSPANDPNAGPPSNAVGTTGSARGAVSDPAVIVAPPPGQSMAR